MDVYPKLRQNLNLPIARIFLEALEIEGASPKQFHLALASAMQAETAPSAPVQHRFCHHHQRISIAGSTRHHPRPDRLLRCHSNSATSALNAGAVTGGISEALVSTAAGLVVAIGTLLFANLFRGLYKRQLALIQEYGGQLEILYETHYERRNQLKEGAFAT